MPADITQKLFQELNRTLALPALQKRFAELSFEALGGSPKELSKLMQTESANMPAL